MKVCHVFRAASLFVLSAATAFAQDNAPAGNVKAGQQVYKAVGCWQCHGTLGQGGGPAGPRIAPTALPFAAYLQQLRVPQNAMAPYEPKILSYKQAADIYAFLKSVPAAKPVAEIPLLNDLK